MYEVKNSEGETVCLCTRLEDAQSFESAGKIDKTEYTIIHYPIKVKETNMSQVAVIHTAFEESPRTVAFVNIPEDARSTDEALEYAYRWTNNVMGSWSRTDIEDNGDYNPDVTVMAPLGEGGMGLRSTSMGDQMLIGNKKYKVAAFGFEEIV
jgi:hypothetical protein